jgi:iron complex outermembrane recepter protein
MPSFPSTEPMTRRLVRTAALAFAALPAPLSAQQEPPDTTIRPVAVAPVVVTVLRAPLPLAVAPAAVSVIDARAAQRAQPGLSLEEVLRGVPGLHVENRHNYAVGERLTVRGFGARPQFGVRGVKVMVDGIPATLPDGQSTLEHIDPRSLGRVEVIRGPASAVYGNAAGGVVQFESVMPVAGESRAEASLGVGPFETVRAHLLTGGQVGRVGYVANASLLDYAGYREHSAARNVLWGARAEAERGAQRVRLSLSFASHEAENPGSLSEAQLRTDRYGAFATNVQQATGKSGRHMQAGLRWRSPHGAGEWDAAAFVVGRSIVNPIPARVIDLERAAFGARLLHHRAAGRLRWTAGVEAEEQRDDRQNHLNVRGERGALVLDQAERVTNLATFAQALADVAPGVNLLAGLRYDAVRFRVTDRFLGDGDDSAVLPAMSELSPSVGLSVRVVPGVQLFSNLSTAFETPTTTELANRPTGGGGFNAQLEPQRTLSGEAGVRGGTGSRLSYHAALFRAHAWNALIPFEVPDEPGRQFFRNAGSTRHQGVEAGLSAGVARWLRTDLAYTRADVRFVDFAIGDRRFDGNRVPGVVPHRLDARAVVDLPRDLFLELDVRRASETPVNDANDATSARHTVVELRAGGDLVHVGRWRTRVYGGVTNLFDARYNTAVVVNAFGGRYFEPGPGRALFIGVGTAMHPR